ncbi:hypothetical protein UlMin_041942 [Ulmus minor]
MKVEREMEMEVFSANPKSFKIHRESPLASNLKSAISTKLHDFLANLTDDILADYVTILVCNGKNQYQAREYLDAFLGTKSEEFVSWLWGHLMTHSHLRETEKDLLNPSSVSVSGGQSGGRDKGSKIHRNGSSSRADKLLTKDKRNSRPAFSNDRELAKGTLTCPLFAAAVKAVSTEMGLPKKRRNEISRRVEAAESIFGKSFTYDSSEKGVPSVVLNNRNQHTLCLNKSKQILERKCIGLSKELLSLSARDFALQDKQSSESGLPFSGQTCVSNVLERSISLRSVGVPIHCTEKPGRSVWDRLGKPEGNSDDLNALGYVKQDEVPNHHALLASGLACEVPNLAERHGCYNNPAENEKSKYGVIATCEPHLADNIRRKRLFGEISTGPSTGSLTLACKRKTDHLANYISRNVKKSNLITKDLNADPNKKMLDVKQKLQQIEMEMSKLRLKQAVMEKDGKHSLLSSASELKHPEEDIESRTIFVTNVHFAATKEALFSYFGKCGVIVDLIILTDPLTAKPKGSAYVTYASKQSVDQAVALSGTQFLSRILKVVRKAEAASAPIQLSGKPTQVALPYGKKKAVPINSSLQWRRENVQSSTNSLKEGST